MLNTKAIDTKQAGTLARAGNFSMLHVAQALTTLREAAEQQERDTRSPEVQALDKQFPPAAPEQYVIRYGVPGQEPAMTPELKQFDSNVRGWMSDAGLPQELGNSLANTLSKAIQHTHAMSAEQRERYKDAENLKLEKLFGPDWHDTKLKPVAVMIHELDQKRPGLKALIRAHGDNALFIAQLIQAATIYHVRKGR